MTRFGIVGCGNIATTHAEAIAPLANAALTVVYDELPERAQAIASKYGVEAAPSLDALFAACDAVIVALPSSLHAPTTIRAAQAGKHVLTEKPLDIAIEPARAMVGACESSGVTLGCISQHRFARDVRTLRDSVA
ncbi:Gfo/Idh/MocA family oxidoreductase, partial [bacterium]